METTCNMKTAKIGFATGMLVAMSLCLQLAPLVLPSAEAAEEATITIEASKPGPEVSRTLYGIFFEEINRAGDGGLYAEMIQNRSFEDDLTPLSWTLLKGANAEADMSLDKSHPLNPNNPTCLRLEIKHNAGTRVGVANEGFKGAPDGTFTSAPHKRTPEAQKKLRAKFEKQARESNNGIAVETGKTYNFSLYAQGEAGFEGPLTVDLEKQDGTVIASKTIDKIGAQWQKFEGALVANATDTNVRLVVSTTKPGTVLLDMVSLFPKDTFKGRPNGMRADLAEMLVKMHPAFIRFPGGCFVEGDTLDEAARWKKTIGDIAERPGQWNRWGYLSSNGLGFHEYLQLCEDLGAEPLFVINVGMSHKENVPMDKMGEFVQDALDAIEYANGPVDSKWGALRAKAGHPAPFNLKYMEIGNENGGPAYFERYALMHDAIKKRYPEMNLIACSWHGIPTNRPLDILDEHCYSFPEEFAKMATRFDSYDRNGPKIYMGEYAVTRGNGAGKLVAALGEAAFMTGMERNADIVLMSSYAPLFELAGWRNWSPNAIVYDNAHAFGIPSYYAQAMFAANRADVNLPVEVSAPKIPQMITGRVGVGVSGIVKAEFKDFRISQSGKTLVQTDFSKGLQPFGGKQVTRENDALTITNPSGGDVVSYVGGWDTSCNDYVLNCKVRKVSGTGGLLIVTGKDTADSWWTLGGFGNTAHSMNLPLTKPNRIPGKIDTGRWYDIRVEVKGPTARCYLDGQLIEEATREPVPGLFAVAGRKKPTNEIILKVVNMSQQPQATSIRLEGAGKLKPTAKALVMASEDPLAENSFEKPDNVVPAESVVDGIGTDTKYTFPANSITILHLNEAN